MLNNDGHSAITNSISILTWNISIQEIYYETILFLWKNMHFIYTVPRRATELRLNWISIQWIQCRIFSFVLSCSKNRFSASDPAVTTWKFNAPIWTRKLKHKRHRLLPIGRWWNFLHLLWIHCDLFDCFHHIDLMQFSLHTILIVNVHCVRSILMVLIFGHLFGK